MARQFASSGFPKPHEDDDYTPATTTTDTGLNVGTISGAAVPFGSFLP